ncbi:hypothetical protein PanWU01x14_220510 [Parasponia andersonii]|uniref:Uncharacterized protein n=1 Tax=Parasponia andersonii TaxID=3476 RepID=A0A2P5BPZ5_PARAD|nr:hypothetical protein PanWU01x14_220510 [Parasponia andersonii]
MENDACEITTKGMVVDCCHQLQRATGSKVSLCSSNSTKVGGFKVEKLGSSKIGRYEPQFESPTKRFCLICRDELSPEHNHDATENIGYNYYSLEASSITSSSHQQTC